ncbi:serine/threonine dehydratase [Actinomadura sp. NBRC 104425]|uniref:threonine ammonia-lyase n=1 Tax=Actinomadura sp. NBRC 104425 TaxID=3032204 RepID=UPI0024A42298|nr:threonine/serine dehydratase [Actinomadura sp. NBRC 104425]GLZ15193.1 serine/threonine dehydratase [Actinomadura sp. NBRC 104425]
MSDLVSLADVERAAERLAGVCVRTPLVPFPSTDPPLLVKAESFQPIGAFKLRGAYAAISALPDRQRARGVVTHSSGNHAQAVAYTARLLGIRAVLVIPHTTPGVKVDACVRHGAEIVYVEPTMEARIATAEKLAEAHGFAMIPPFDDPRIVAGQGTVGLEIAQDCPEADVVLVPVGGGGLLAGVAAAVKALRPQAKVIGVEPELAADARASLRAGHPVSWAAEETGRTVADALRAQRLGDVPFAHISEFVDGIVTVTEDEIRQGVRRLAREARLIAEPAGAVATAAYLFRRDELPDARTYVSVLSGGNVDPALFLDIYA